MGQGGVDLGRAYAAIEIDHSRTEQGLRTAQDAFTGALDRIGSQFDRLGSRVSDIGGKMTQLAAPFAIGLGLAVNAAMSFEEEMQNVGAVLNKSGDELDALSAKVLAIGETSRAGPQAVATAFYDIVGGVADASAHMAILEASVATAEAGNAELGGTTKALIAIMNSYKLEAKDAARVSDVLTTVVGKGVGTMDEFAVALPSVTGLAKSTGIELEDLGGMMAYLTTQGNSASSSATQLSAMMTALLNPNAKMKKGLQELGYESGQAAIENLGLAGTYKALQQGSYGGEIASLTGSVEALRGVTALTSEGVDEFLTTFKEGAEGATEAARAIQLKSTAAQFDLLKNKITTAGIEIGNVLLPVLVQLMDQLKPLIDSFVEWIRTNPEVVKTIGMIVGALIVLGPILSMVGGAITAIGTVLAVLASPIALIVAAIAGLYIAFETNFLGIRDLIQPVIDQVSIFLTGAFQQFANFIQTAVLPALQQLADWFVRDALPAVIAFVQGTVVPAFQSFIGFLGNLWAVVGPALVSLADWFLTTGLPAIQTFITETAIPAIQGFINILLDVWNAVAPVIVGLVDWFVTTGFPIIQGIIETVVIPVIQSMIDILKGIWEVVAPVIQGLLDWFTMNGWPTIEGVINFAIGTVGLLIQVLSDIWTKVQPFLEAFKTGIAQIFGWIVDNVIKPVTDAIGGIISKVQEALAVLSDLDRSGQGRGGLFGSGIGPDIDPIGGIRDWGSRDNGGPGIAGQAYLIGKGAQPEAFIPSTNGSFIPNFDKVLAGIAGRSEAPNDGMNFYEGSIVIRANSEAEGLASARGFVAEMEILKRSRG